MEPPDDYRELSVCPTSADFEDVVQPFLTAMKKKGKFESTYQYLDANFRLLKEDFMQDLREGLQRLREMKSESDM